MRKRLIWIAAALVLIAIPAVIGLVALRNDESSSEARRAAALLTPEAAEAGGKTTLVIAGSGTPAPLQGKEIELESFSWGVSNAATTTATGGAGAGKATFQDFNFTKKADASSPSLMTACATGKHFPTVTLNVRKAGAERASQPYMTIKLTDVIISSYQQGGGGDMPTEQLSLNYSKIEVSYRDQDAKGGLGPPEVGGYDLKLQKGI